MDGIYSLNEDEMIVIATSLRLTITSIESAYKKDSSMDKETIELYTKTMELLNRIEQYLF